MNNKIKKEIIYLSNVSILLWPAPSTQCGFALHCTETDKNNSSPFQNGTISSLVPWIIYTGHATADIL